MGELSELQGQTQGETLEAVYEKFNIDHPTDYKGHSLSVSDIVVLHQDGENTAHFVDSFGFIPNVVQTESALFGIRISSSIIPALTFVVGVFALLFYPISKHLNEKIQHELAVRRSNKV